jgi:hypothetical protein
MEMAKEWQTFVRNSRIRKRERNSSSRTSPGPRKYDTTCTACVSKKKDPSSKVMSSG